MKHNEATPEQRTEEQTVYALCEKLRAMRMSAMAAEVLNQYDDPNQSLKDFWERMSGVIDAEYNMRHSKKFNRYLKKANLKYPAAVLDDTIYDPERKLNTDDILRLMTCKWVNEGRNLLITGPAGSGKTYLASNLGIAALNQFKTVRYERSNTLIHTLEQAEANGVLNDKVNYYGDFDLLMIDDFGMMTLEVDACRNLFEVIDARYPGKSTMIVSPFGIEEWYDFFKDNIYAEACLGRLITGQPRLTMDDLRTTCTVSGNEICTVIPEPARSYKPTVTQLSRSGYTNNMCCASLS